MIGQNKISVASNLLHFLKLTHFALENRPQKNPISSSNFQPSIFSGAFWVKTIENSRFGYLTSRFHIYMQTSLCRFRDWMFNELEKKNLVTVGRHGRIFGNPRREKTERWCHNSAIWGGDFLKKFHCGNLTKIFQMG